MVVEVNGLDADRVRRDIGKELGVTAVAPDDPMARSAAGHVVVAAADKKITVTYQKVAAPVTRSVEQPDDASRAASTAVLLAGNLARDEAGELAAAMRKPAPPPPPRLDDEHDERDLARLRIVLKDSAVNAHDLRRWGGFTTLGSGLLLAGAGTWVGLSPHPNDSAKGFVLSAAIGGGALTLTGIVELAGLFTSADEDALAEFDATSGTPSFRLQTAEAAWQKRADDARSARKFGGTFALVVGVIGMGVSTGMLLFAGPHQTDSTYTGIGILYGASVINVVLGGATLFLESPTERGWRTWQTARLGPRVGVAPAPGGGMISLGFSF